MSCGQLPARVRVLSDPSAKLDWGDPRSNEEAHFGRQAEGRAGGGAYVEGGLTGTVTDIASIGVAAIDAAVISTASGNAAMVAALAPGESMRR